MPSIALMENILGGGRILNQRSTSRKGEMNDYVTKNVSHAIACKLKMTKLDKHN